MRDAHIKISRIDHDGRRAVLIGDGGNFAYHHLCFGDWSRVTLDQQVYRRHLGRFLTSERSRAADRQQKYEYSAHKPPFRWPSRSRL